MTIQIWLSPEWRRVVGNRLALSVPFALLTVLSGIMGYRYITELHLPWLQGENSKLYVMISMIVLADMSVTRLQKIVRSFIGDRYFHC